MWGISGVPTFKFAHMFSKQTDNKQVTQAQVALATLATCFTAEAYGAFSVELDSRYQVAEEVCLPSV